MKELQKRKVVWTDNSGDSWFAVLHLSPLRGRMECVGVELLSYPAGSAEAIGELRPVTASLIRQFRLGEVLSTELEEMAEPWSVVANSEEELDLLVSQKATEAEAARDAAKGSGQRGHPPAHYAKVADVYARAWADGGNPTATVAERFRVSRATAAQWVARARERGFLEPTTQGRGGGVPGAENGDESA